MLSINDIQHSNYQWYYLPSIKQDMVSEVKGKKFHMRHTKK